jgi:hypothetical protein
MSTYQNINGPKLANKYLFFKLLLFSLNFLSAFWAEPPDKLAEAMIITL